MRVKKTFVSLLIMLALSACNVFLGTEPDDSPQAIFDRIWNDYKETYGAFEDRGVNWNEVRKKYAPLISSGMSDYYLFLVCSDMINTLNDLHSGLTSPFGNSASLNENWSMLNNRAVHASVHGSLNEDHSGIANRGAAYINVNEYLNDGYKETGEGKLLWGTFKSDKSKRPVGYISIQGFGLPVFGSDIIPSWVKEIDGIVKSLLKDTDALVLDLRYNEGGIGSNMEYIAARFTSVQKPYIKSCTRNGPGYNDFSPFKTWEIKPAETRYTKPIVLLTSYETVSAGEWFTMALRTQAHVTHAGGTTRGALSAMAVCPLINGWSYTKSVQKVRGPKGEKIEGRGIEPDISLDWDMLRQALALLNP
jgi:hypothetical protein